MSFWDTSDGDSAAKDVQKEYETGGGTFDPIPNDTDALAIIDQAKWQKKGEGSDAVSFIELRWKVEKPEAFQNRVVFQKLWVSDLDPGAKTEEKAKEKRDKARRMLATIDANARGHLVKSSDAPTDDSLALALNGSTMVIKVMEWSMEDRQTGGVISGNWISAVKPKDAPLKVGKALSKPAPQAGGAGGAGGSGTGGGFDLDDEIPFAPEWRA